MEKNSTAIAPEAAIPMNTKGVHVDLSYLFTQTRGNIVMVKKMVGLYLKQTPELLNTIISAVDEKDWVTVNTAVHKMIPSFWMMGVNPSMEAMARTIQEQSSKHLNLPELPALCREFEKGCLLACAELGEMLKDQD